MEFKTLSENEAYNIEGGVALIAAVVIWGCCAVLGGCVGAGYATNMKKLEEAHGE